MKAIQLIDLAKQILAADSTDKAARLTARCPGHLQDLLASNIASLKLAYVFKQQAKVAKLYPRKKHVSQQRRAPQRPANPITRPVSQVKALNYTARLKQQLQGHTHEQH